MININIVLVLQQLMLKLLNDKNYNDVTVLNNLLKFLQK